MRLTFKNILNTLLCAGALLTTSLLANADSKVVTKQEEAKVKTNEVEIKDIKLHIPANWKQSKPSSRLRLAQFEIPATKGDSFKTELQIFNFGGGGGGFDANIKRWVSQFNSTGRKVKTTKGTCPQGNYYLVDITGTYNMSVGPPFLRKTKACEDARMLAVILQVKGNKGNYFLKLPGTETTVEKITKQFRASFGAVEKDEKEYELK